MDDKCDTRLYVGNLDKRITESNVIKMFTPFGKIMSEEFLWHTRGPRRGEPRGYVFIQYSTKEEAELAKAKMDGRLACGRPLVVRLASEKCLLETSNQLKPSCDGKKPSAAGCTSGMMNRSAKIAAIKNKLKSLEGEGVGIKKLRETDSSTSTHETVSSARKS
ncbi:RNA recognition motif domain-containing protein [Dioscorea alata]|uniref:RNA recognition motif domain-containing protein n=1 Tax=Dioscorea alata TaxID=55571 RepID=A0ACB7UUV2_DIOAL|nr:RNA recognition motif domain-containing protein [Dioscorea alata]